MFRTLGGAVIVLPNLTRSVLRGY